MAFLCYACNISNIIGLFRNANVLNIYLDYSIDVEECLENPCDNGATCIEQLGFYECDCPLGWQGTHCNVGKKGIRKGGQT